MIELLNKSQQLRFCTCHHQLPGRAARFQIQTVSGVPCLQGSTLPHGRPSPNARLLWMFRKKKQLVPWRNHTRPGNPRNVHMNRKLSRCLRLRLHAAWTPSVDWPFQTPDSHTTIYNQKRPPKRSWMAAIMLLRLLNSTMLLSANAAFLLHSQTAQTALGKVGESHVLQKSLWQTLIHSWPTQLQMHIQHARQVTLHTAKAGFWGSCILAFSMAVSSWDNLSRRNKFKRKFTSQGVFGWLRTGFSVHELSQSPKYTYIYIKGSKMLELIISQL